MTTHANAPRLRLNSDQPPHPSSPKDKRTSNSTPEEQASTLGESDSHYEQALNAADKLSSPNLTCPYHISILGMAGNFRISVGLGPLERFLEEGPSEQYAVFNRPDDGKLSIDKGCVCKELLRSKK